ncbi:hypothetical protein CP10139811_0156 [Chlamydia ibidis]|uniref:Transmembrane protein n=2 Tax=Chlamydia ibidis TaxID=1405396 RepID=S7KG05_9CHLA|nr:DUF1389 domain-containing protein [Chlamydia ibidis]EPP35116.1 hypothetical protein CP10139811_0156 [Chlamydia ibidis]EQM62587.1 hypothetical protein H359_0598 [Chlamydia ibidis 10-1398/6]
MSITIIHSLFKNDCSCHPLYSFEKRLKDRANSALIFLILAIITSLLSIIPAILLSSYAGLILGGALLSVSCMFFLLSRIPHLLRTHIPQNLKEILKKHYPRIIIDLIEKAKLSVEELRLILPLLNNEIELRNEDIYYRSETAFNRSLGRLSEDIKLKLSTYGIKNLLDKLDRECLEDLNTILLKSCPIYWLKQFVESAPKITGLSSPIGMRKEVTAYCLGGAASRSITPSVFRLENKILAKSITSDDFTILQSYYSSEKLENSEIDAVKERILDVCQKQCHTFSSSDHFSTPEKIRNACSQALTEMLAHGLSWAQLSLIHMLDDKNWGWLNLLDGGNQRIRRFAVQYLGEITDEQHYLYEPLITLATWDDLFSSGVSLENLLKQNVRNPEKRIARYLEKYARYHDKINILSNEEDL